MVAISFSRVILTLVAFESIALFLLALRVRQSAIEDKQIFSLLDSTPIPKLQNSSDVFSAVAAIDNGRHHLYGDEELNVEAMEQSMDCTKAFMRKYSDYCEKALVPGPEFRNSYHYLSNNLRISSLCPCISPYLKGRVYVKWLMSVVDQADDRHPELAPGGHWRPTWCIPRQRIAIIVPFRNRPYHLKAFIRVIHPFLQRQLHYYTIFVIEQTEPWVFNKATVMNIGFKEALARDNFDCFIFHDVDMIPEDDLNFYGCYKTPRHVGIYLDRHQYTIWYPELFGGATAFTRKQMESLNGYSNEFYGWGGEDDDMYNRVLSANMTILRFPDCVARYTSLQHERDPGNPLRYNDIAFGGMTMRPDVYKTNGLNSLTYRLVNWEARLLYTWIAVALPDAPSPRPSGSFTTLRSSASLSLRRCSSVQNSVFFIFMLSMCCKMILA